MVYRPYGRVPRKSLARRIRKWASVFAFLYLSVLVTLSLLQRDILYHPSREMMPAKSYRLALDNITLTTEDGIKLSAWYKPPAEKKALIVYFHGNAQNLAARHKKLGVFSEGGFGLLGLSYRGYGTSEGSPSERGLYKDARTAIQFALAQGIPESGIILYGESLGTGVAIQMATEFPNVKAVVLEAPFTSVQDLAEEIFFYMPIDLVLKDKFLSLSKIPQIKSPVLVFHGEQDSVVPVAHGHKILAAVTSPKDGIFFEDKHHGDFDAKILLGHMKHFLLMQHASSVEAEANDFSMPFSDPSVDSAPSPAVAENPAPQALLPEAVGSEVKRTESVTTPADQ